MRSILIIFALIYSLSVQSTTLVVLNTNDSGGGSLRDAVSNANPGDTIRFHPALIGGSNATLVLNNEIIINKSLTIKGLYNNTDTLFISGNNNTRLFAIYNVGNTTLDSLALINGNGAGNSYTGRGGAVIAHSSDTLQVLNSFVFNNNADNGGGIYLFSATTTLILDNSKIFNNTSIAYGGGIYSHSYTSSLLDSYSSIYISNSELFNNESIGNRGGAIYAQSSITTINATNTSRIELSNTKIKNNLAVNGGGIYSYASAQVSSYSKSTNILKVNDSEISNNSVSSHGGGIYAIANASWSYLKMDINNSNIDSNSAIFGAGIWAQAQASYSIGSSIININGSTIDGNVAAQLGGGVYNRAIAPTVSDTITAFVKVNNSSINNNSSNTSNGGGIFNESNTSSAWSNCHSFIEVDSSTFDNNSSGSHGGAIFSRSFAYNTSTSASSVSDIDIKNSTFSNNTAVYKGGAIFGDAPSHQLAINSYGTVDVDNSTFFNNSAGDEGGGICTYATTLSSPVITNSTLYDNSATFGSGIFSYSFASTTSINIGNSILFNCVPYNQSSNSFTSQGFNILSSFVPGAIGSDYSNVTLTQLKLLPLAFNGGVTQTMLPDTGSLAINSGNPSDMNHAQNAFISEGRREIGAAESVCQLAGVTINDTICFEDSIEINGTVYNSNNPSGIEIFNAVGPNSCDSTVTVALNILPIVTVTNIGQSICDGDSIQIYGNYESAAGIYYDSLQNINGCDSLIATTLTLDSVYFSNQNQSICLGDSILIYGNFESAAGTYYDSLQTINGCDSVLSITLSVNPVYLSNTNDTICQGDSVLIYGNYENTSGVYYDSLQTINGCDSVLSTTLIVNPLPNVTLTNFNPDTICSNVSAVGLPNGSPSGGVYSGIGVNGGTFDPNTAGLGTHSVIYTYTDTNSCINSDSTFITVEQCVGINDLSKDLGILIYPNPNTGLFTIEKPSELDKEVNISLLDATSRVIINKLIPKGQQKIEMDITNYSKGVYYLQLTVGEEVFVKQILKN